jgi:hypothetical protein
MLYYNRMYANGTIVLFFILLLHQTSRPKAYYDSCGSCDFNNKSKKEWLQSLTSSKLPLMTNIGP